MTTTPEQKSGMASRDLSLGDDAACVAGATTLVPDEATYRGYRIYPSLVSYMPASDWTYAHEDYDGAPDAGDNRCGYAASLEACRAEIDERLDQ